MVVFTGLAMAVSRP